VMDLMGTMPYIALDGMLDPAFPKAAIGYRNAQFLTDLSDGAIRTLIGGFQQCPSPMSHIMIEHFHGVATRIPLSATACTTRVSGFNVVVASQWMDPRETDRNIMWAHQTSASLAPYVASRRYANRFEDAAAHPAGVAYGRHLPQLRAIKAKYDPDNIFRQDVNILPA
jgi:FAD/FMN-containing dehydrogenase